MNSLGTYTSKNDSVMKHQLIEYDQHPYFELVDCQVECDSRPQCVAINYFVSNRYCNFINRTILGNVVSENGSIYSAKGSF